MAIARYLVENPDAAVHFYTEKLGFEAGRAFGPVALSHRGDLELWLVGAGRSGRNQVGAAPGGWNRIVLEVPGLERPTAGLTLRGDASTGLPGAGS